MAAIKTARRCSRARLLQGVSNPSVVRLPGYAVCSSIHAAREHEVGSIVRSRFHIASIDPDAWRAQEVHRLSGIEASKSATGTSSTLEPSFNSVAMLSTSFWVPAWLGQPSK